MPEPDQQVGGPCTVCGTGTRWACSDCAIDSGGKRTVYVCSSRTCRDQHDQVCMHNPIVFQ